MKLVIRIIKKSRPHYYTRRLVYMSFNDGKRSGRSEVAPDKHARFVASVDNWNALFKIKYSDFRDGIESICEEYNSRCKFDATFKHVDAFHVLNNFDGFVFTSDEDNLIDAPLPNLLRNHEKAELIKWNNYRVGSNHVAHVWGESRPLVLPTGGYAVPANDGINKWVELLNCHGASSWHMSSFAVLREEPLGLIMVHPSSHGVLSKLLTKDAVKASVDDFLINSNVTIKPRYLSTYQKIVKLYESL